jgi:hypothetical protein
MQWRFGRCFERRVERSPTGGTFGIVALGQRLRGHDLRIGVLVARTGIHQPRAQRVRKFGHIGRSRCADAPYHRNECRRNGADQRRRAAAAWNGIRRGKALEIAIEGFHATRG